MQLQSYKLFWKEKQDKWIFACRKYNIGWKDSTRESGRCVARVQTTRRSRLNDASIEPKRRVVWLDGQLCVKPNDTKQCLKRPEALVIGSGTYGRRLMNFCP